MRIRYCFDHVIVHGLGKTGVAAVHFLADKATKITVIAKNISSPEAKILQADIPTLEVQSETKQTTLPNTATLVLKSPGILPSHRFYTCANQIQCPVISDIELFALFAKAPIIAITGTNGKSTVTHLVHDMLAACGYRVSTGGNVGTPALSLLASPVPDYYILELSSFQLAHTTHLNAKVGVLLNIAPDHIKWHGSVDAYISAKYRLLAQSAVQVVARGLNLGKYPHVSFGTQAPTGQNLGEITRHGQTFLARGKKTLLNINLLSPTLQLPHNRQNCLAALGVLAALNSINASALNTLKDFKGLPHRLECILTDQHISWFNDSKATNLAASITAINSISQTHKKQIIWIGGGILKETDLTDITKAVAIQVKACIFFGEGGLTLFKALKEVCPSIYQRCLKTTIEAAKNLATFGDVVLFSPGGASFDLFDSFEQRGDRFKFYVATPHE